MRAEAEPPRRPETLSKCGESDSDEAALTPRRSDIVYDPHVGAKGVARQVCQRRDHPSALAIEMLDRDQIVVLAGEASLVA
jgi:hypothetical protein